MSQNIETIKELRLASGMGVMACRKALEQNDQDFGRALAALRELAAEQLQANLDRPALEGRIEAYAHHNGRIAVLVDLGCQTEFASRTQTFCSLAHEIALQIASAAPRWVQDADIPQTILEDIQNEAAANARALGKPEQLVSRIKSGALEAFKNENVLLRQKSIRSETTMMAQLIDQAASELGERVTVRRFVRWEPCPEAELQGEQADPTL